MVRSGCLFIIFWLLSHFTAWSQSDSVTVKTLPEVEIFGRPITRYAAGSRVIAIDSTILHLQNNGTLADVLQFRTPIYFKSYGQGMLATAAFRGTSASQTAVLWHGFNINSPTLGQTDFSTIPINGVGQATIQHGSAGATYGTGAIGGAILLTANDNQPEGLQWQAQNDFGAFGYRYSSLGGSYGRKKVNIKTSLFQTQAHNKFPFRNTTKFSSPTEKQENAALLSRGITQDIHLVLNRRQQINFHGWYTFRENLIQPNMVAANTHARQKNENLRLMMVWNQNSALGNTIIRAAYFNDFMHYQDDNNNSPNLVKTYQAQAEHNLAVKEKVSLKVGTEAQYFAADVSGYQRLVSEKRAAVFSLLRYHITPRLQVSGNLRQSFVPGFNPPPAPTLGANYFLSDKVTSSLILKANLSRGYRVPTLNDRFWPSGNKNLIPEASWSYEAGLQKIVKKEKLTLNAEATLYYLNVDNWIQWIPSTVTGQWEPQNLKNVTSKGLELSIEGSYRLSLFKFSAGNTYAYTRTEQQKSYLVSGEPLNRQLIYVPKHTTNTWTTLGYKNWLATTNFNFTGYRFTTATNDRWLPSFALLNLSVGKSFSWPRYRFQILAKVNNATNRTYQTMEYYAMPQRHYALSLRFYFL